MVESLTELLLSIALRLFLTAPVQALIVCRKTVRGDRRFSEVLVENFWWFLLWLLEYAIPFDCEESSMCVRLHQRRIDGILQDSLPTLVSRISLTLTKGISLSFESAISNSSS